MFGASEFFEDMEDFVAVLGEVTDDNEDFPMAGGAKQGLDLIPLRPGPFGLKIFKML